MRTVEEVKDRIDICRSQLKRDDTDKLYVVTAGRLFARKVSDKKNSPFEMLSTSLPSTFDKNKARERMSYMSKKYPLLKLHITTYKNWLCDEVSYLENLISSSRMSCREHREIEEEETESNSDNLRRISHVVGPCGNNCIICKYNLGIDYNDELYVKCIAPKDSIYHNVNKVR